MISDYEMIWDATKKAASRVTLIYFVASLIWIVASDWLLLQVAANMVELDKLEVAKGLLFVTLTTLLVYVLSAQAIGAVQSRLEAATALSESEDRFRNLFQRLPIGVYYAGVDGTVTEINRRGAELLGLDGKALGFESWPVEADTMHRSAFTTRRLADIAAGKIYCEELKILRDGQIATMLDIGRPDFDKGNSVTGYLGTLSDMTDLYRTRASLALRDEQHRTLLASSSAGFLVIVNGEIAYLNDAVRAFMGGDGDGTTLGSFLAKLEQDQANRVASAIRRCLVDANMNVSERVTLRRRDGTRIPLLVTGVPGQWDGEVAFMATLIDLSALVEQLDQLRHHQLALFAAWEPMAFLGDSGQLRDANPAMAELCGLTLDESRDLADWAHSEHSRKIIEEALAAGHPWQGRMTIVGAHSLPVEVEAKVTPTTPGHRNGGILWLRDRSERDRLTRELARWEGFHDATGLRRRNAFLEACDQLAPDKHAVICVFHYSNADSLVRSAGLSAFDEVLATLANELCAVFPKNTVIASVTEQDMAVLLTDVTGTNMAAAMAKDAVARMQNAATHAAPKITTGVSLIEPGRSAGLSLEAAIIASRGAFAE